MAKKVVPRPVPRPPPPPVRAQPARPAPAAPPSRGPLPLGRPQPSTQGTARAAAPELDFRDDGPEHRQFPRARIAVPVSLWIGEGEERRFSATLRSINVSVSGLFLESTFFLPVGTELELSFPLDSGAEPVKSRAQVVRDERPGPRSPDGRSGMGLRFVEFHAQTEVTLARLFLAERLSAFAESYLKSKRARSMGSELDRVIDALAAWELQKVTAAEGDDPWRGLRPG